MTELDTLFYSLVKSPIGDVLVVGDDEAIHCISFCRGRNAVELDPAWLSAKVGSGGARDAGGLVRQAAAQVSEYFAGERQEFTFPVEPGGTVFQKQVWAELRRIPYGQTISYGELARRLGRPSAARAVGAANGRNPIPLAIPCHRVIGANGNLVGFAGGTDLKEALLRLEC